MNFMNVVPQEIALKGTLSMSAHLLKQPKQRIVTKDYTVVLPIICASLRVNLLNDLRLLMGNLGTLKRDGDGWVMQPKEIPKQTFGAWINGKEKMPIWRLAQAVTILESVYVQQKADAKAMNLPGDDIFWEHLSVSAKWISAFNQDDKLAPWLHLLRQALHVRLKIDSARSAEVKKFFHCYEDWLLSCGALEKEHEGEVSAPT
jgi:hypothetical protein